LRQVLSDILATDGHLRIELERLKVQLGRKVSADTLERLLQGTQTDGAPGTRNIRDKINFEGLWHRVA
jgi:hypothetical protein